MPRLELPKIQDDGDGRSVIKANDKTMRRKSPSTWSSPPPPPPRPRSHCGHQGRLQSTTIMSEMESRTIVSEKKTIFLSCEATFHIFMSRISNYYLSCKATFNIISAVLPSFSRRHLRCVALSPRGCCDWSVGTNHPCISRFIFTYSAVALWCVAVECACV